MILAMQATNNSTILITAAVVRLFHLLGQEQSFSVSTGKKKDVRVNFHFVC